MSEFNRLNVFNVDYSGSMWFMVNEISRCQGARLSVSGLSSSPPTVLIGNIH